LELPERRIAHRSGLPLIQIGAPFRGPSGMFSHMTAVSWAKRFAFVYVGAFLILSLAGLLRSRGLEQSLAHAAIWSPISASIFIATRLYWSRKGRHCALCCDKPATYRAGEPQAQRANSALP
jgi:hypothetical protein